MRLILFASLIVFLTSCNNVTKPRPIDGTWIPVKQEFQGKPMPTAALEKQQLIINDSTYTVIAESVDKGVVKYNGNKMDIYSREGVNKGQHFTAIYKHENEELTICYNLAGDSYPTDFESKSKPVLFLSVFKRKL